MRACAILAAMFTCSVMLAEDKKDEKKDVKPAVKEIATKDLKLKFPEKGKATEPTTIKSEEELAKDPVVGSAADALKKQIDFEKQNLLVFAWAGSGGDKLTASIGAEDKKSIVYVEYIRGLTRDLRQHIHLFAVPKDLKVVVEVAK